MSLSDSLIDLKAPKDMVLAMIPHLHNLQRVEWNGYGVHTAEIVKALNECCLDLRQVLNGIWSLDEELLDCFVSTHTRLEVIHIYCVCSLFC